ncbi:MAG: hypothetical protein FWC23_00470 [Chitinispirillia bacterium]|nr:hypothetical protein [Chitinispirillia bacterium]MCL2267648.1 hypothetical protein [Chitinispirillia bacterium]
MGASSSIIIRNYRPEIEKYCEDNAISASKVFSSWISGNNTIGRVAILGPGDPERGELGMLDDVPLPVVLKIFLENGKLRFEQTEHTYLYKEEFAEETALV